MGGPMGMMTLTRRYFFQSVHALTEGARIESTHGHGYHLEITGENVSPDEIDAVYEELIQPRLHGKRLVGELEPSTGEHIVDWIHDQLLKSAVADRVRGVALQETAKNRFVSSKTETKFV